MSMVHHPLYGRWRFIVGVTTNPNDINYKNYAGGKGILNKFRDFDHFAYYVESKLGLPVGDKNRLYRKNPNGHYAPGNLAWGSAIDVSYKQKNVYKLKYKGKTQTIGDWSRELNIPYDTLLIRNRRGWSVSETLGFKKRSYRGK